MSARRGLAVAIGVGITGCAMSAPRPLVGQGPAPASATASPAPRLAPVPSFAPNPTGRLDAIARIQYVRPDLHPLGFQRFQLTFLFFTAPDGDPVLFAPRAIAIRYAFFAPGPAGASLGAGSLVMREDAQRFVFTASGVGPMPPTVRCELHAGLPDGRAIDEDATFAVGP